LLKYHLFYLYLNYQLSPKFLKLLEYLMNQIVHLILKYQMNLLHLKHLKFLMYLKNQLFL
jgi:hypothetical protein